jgi:hypothetical protein
LGFGSTTATLIIGPSQAFCSSCTSTFFGINSCPTQNCLIEFGGGVLDPNIITCCEIDGTTCI